MVVLAPGARDPGRPTFQPMCSRAPGRCCRCGSQRGWEGAGVGGQQELEFILRSLVDLRLQIEELRRRLDDHPQRVQVIDLGDHAQVSDDSFQRWKKTAISRYSIAPGMTMADVEKATIEAALGSTGQPAPCSGSARDRRATLYRKIKVVSFGGSRS